MVPDDSPEKPVATPGLMPGCEAWEWVTHLKEWCAPDDRSIETEYLADPGSGWTGRVWVEGQGWVRFFRGPEGEPPLYVEMRKETE